MANSPKIPDWWQSPHPRPLPKPGGEHAHHQGLCRALQVFREGATYWFGRVTHPEPALVSALGQDRQQGQPHRRQHMHVLVPVDMRSAISPCTVSNATNCRAISARTSSSGRRPRRDFTTNSLSGGNMSGRRDDRHRTDRRSGGQVQMQPDADPAL